MSGGSAARFRAFIFPREGDRWLTILRVGLGLQFAIYALTVRTSWSVLFGQSGNGLVSRELSELLSSAQSPLLPKLEWLLSAMERIGLHGSSALSLIWFALLATACSLMAGFLCRPSAFVAWFIHLCAVNSCGLLSYGVDNFMTIGMFYLILAPSPDRFSLDRKRFGRVPRFPEVTGFFRRVLQVHLCFIYFSGGLAKALGSGWWDGSNLWRSLTQPPFNILPLHFLILWKDLLPVFGVCILLLEITYPILIWWKRTRTVCLLSMCVLHVGIGVGLGMPLFALIMIVLNLAAFASLPAGETA